MATAPSLQATCPSRITGYGASAYDELTCPCNRCDDQIAHVLFEPTREPAHNLATSAGNSHAPCPPVPAPPAASALSRPLALDHRRVAVMTFRAPQRDRALPTFAAAPLSYAVISA